MLKIEGNRGMDEYLELLSSSLKIYMDSERLYKAYDEVCAACDDYKSLALMWLRIESGGAFHSVTSDDVTNFLLSIGVDLYKRYANKKTKNLSLDMKKVITPLIEAGVTPEFLTEYKNWRTYKSYVGTLRGLVTARKYFGTTTLGRILLEYDTRVEEQENMRAYYKDIAVVSVPKRYSSMITTPTDNHFIAWCDYPQADWRFAYNLFIRDHTNEQIMRECDDAYEGLARIVEGAKFNKEDFRENRKTYKVNCLSTFYGSKARGDIPTALREFYQSCPKYSKLLYDLNVLYQFKLPIPCTSYFGFEQLLPEGSYPEAFVSKGLNTPIQTFTSHVVNETVFGVLEKFWELGYTKEQANVYYVRHDEPLFMFSRDVIKDAWVFQECSEIYIPGFTPIHLDFHYGLYYQEEDASLVREINESIDSADHEYTVYSDNASHEDYSPVPSVESVYMQLYPVGTRYRVAFYDYRTQSRKDVWVDSAASMSLDDVALKAIENGVLEWLNSPRYLLVRSNGLDIMEMVGPEDAETLVKVMDRHDPAIDMREEVHNG